MRRFTLLWVSLMCFLFVNSMLLVHVESDDTPGPSPAARCRGGSSERTVLIEVNTADWCVWCPGQKHSLERLYNELGHDNLVILEYHGDVNDELTSSYAQQRRLYYGGLAYPAVGVDGGGPYNDNRLWESGSDMKYGKYDEDKAMYNQEKMASARSNMTISLTGNVTANTVNIKATVEATDPITVGNLWLRFVLYQNNIYHRDANTNENFGILHRVFNHVVRDGFETALPPTFSMGDTFEADHVFAINPFWYPSTDIRELGVGVFVQTDNKIPRTPPYYNAEVMQAASIEFVQSPIVLINKDLNDAYDDGFDRYDEFLTKAGLGHKNWDTMEAFETEMMNMRMPPTYGEIQDYAVQLWFTGSSDSTFDPPQRTAIDSGLSADQAVYVVGEEIAYQAFLTGSLPWLQGSLHADYASDNAGAMSVDGIPADPISNGMAGLPIYGADPDVITAVPGAFDVFRYTGVGTTAAVRADHDSDSGVFYMAFNYFEGISSYPPDPTYDPDGELLMQRASSYLDGVAAPRVDVVQPDGGEVLTPGGQYEIWWDAKDVDIPQDGVEIQFAEDSGAPIWVTIVTGEPNDGIHLWDVPVVQTNKARVRVCARDSQAQTSCATSDANFTIGTPGDTTPPVIQNVLVDGLTSVMVVEGTSVTLTAQVSDFFTGGSNVSGANYTDGQQAWPGAPMSATDGAFDEVTENVIATVDTTGWAPGDHRMYVYGWDDAPNYNTDSTAYATITIIGPDNTPPEINDVWIDGAPSQAYGLSTIGPTVQLTAVIDDSATGNNNIGNANFTTAPMAWPGAPMLPFDGSWDSPTETAYVDIVSPGVGVYNFHVYAEDIVPNYNNSGPFATLTVLDDIAPDISKVLIEGQPSATITEGTASVTLTATVNDTGFGDSLILFANYTTGMQAWPGTMMNPSDGSFDTATEDVDAIVDTSALTAGFYDLCVYASDVEMNENTVGACAQLEVVLELVAPEVTTVRIDGQAARTVPMSTLPVVCTLTATVDDAGTGGSNIGGANYTTPTPGNWPGTPMTASDGSFDSPTEDVEATFSAPSARGTYAYYVYAWDAKGNYNNSAPFAFLIIQDDIPPELSNSLVNGVPSITVSQGTILTLTATASDALTGDSNIASANYTEGFANWASSAPLNPVDGSFDSPTENLEASVDTSGWTMGVHDLYIYATDAAGNLNVTSVEHVSINITIPDTWPPKVLNARLDGATWVGVNEGDVVTMTATIDDLSTGDSLIGGANYTLGAQNWPGTMLNAADGAFDSSIEDVTLSIDTTGWTRANHTLCLYAWDIIPNENTTSTECAYLEILAVMPLAPMMTGADLAGPGLPDVEIRWDRSGDDGIGYDDVIEYDVYQATSFAGPYGYVTSVAATNSPTYSWTCSGCGVGDANAYFFYVEADNGALTRAAPNKASKFTQSLAEGPNLISIPLILSSADIAFALQTVQFDKAYYYDSADSSADPWKSYAPFKPYKGDLWTIDRTMALWVNVTSASDLVAAGLVPQSTIITLRAGWNLVGFPSFASAYTVADLKVDVNASSVEEPDLTALPYCLRRMNDSDAFIAGRGYWIEVPADTIWTLVN